MGAVVRSYLDLVGMSNEELTHIDPVEMNLLVARSIPSLSKLDIGFYQRNWDEWAAGVRARMPGAEKVFRRSPEAWKGDIRFFRLATLCEHLDCTVGVGYKEEHKYAKAVSYTNPSDLFLNGLMDTLRGSCGSMATLHVAIGWKLGWPVSLACANSHVFCRYDDGLVTYNIEATRTGEGGFSSPSDFDALRIYELSPKAVSSGSDLRAVTPRELLGIFVRFRGRHMRDVGNLAEADKDYMLARHLFPRNRYLYKMAVLEAIHQSADLFDPDEEGTPTNLAEEITLRYGRPRLNGRDCALPGGVDFLATAGRCGGLQARIRDQALNRRCKRPASTKETRPR